MSQERCWQTLGVVATSTECSEGCEVMQIVLEKNRREGDGSRERLEQIAREIGRTYCPRGAEMNLPRGSRRLTW